MAPGSVREPMLAPTAVPGEPCPSGEPRPSGASGEANVGARQASRQRGQRP